MAVLPVYEHPWDVEPLEARQIQVQLGERAVLSPLPPEPATVAGIDVSIKEGKAIAAVVVLSYPELAPVDAALAEVEVSFPYVPGLLAFREGPAVLAALEGLAGAPDILLFDGQGYAHPRRMGLATHLGVLVDVPSVGCAKSRLVGSYDEPAERKGSWTALREGEELIGAVVRTRDRVRPVFVSPGHRADVGTAVSLVLGCARTYRLPEPIRWAHRVAGGAAPPDCLRPATVEH